MIWVRYHKFYVEAKGNLFKNKKVLIEAIYKQKAEKIKKQELLEQQEARRRKNVEFRKKKLEKRLKAYKEDTGK